MCHTLVHVGDRQSTHTSTYANSAARLQSLQERRRVSDPPRYVSVVDLYVRVRVPVRVLCSFIPMVLDRSVSILWWPRRIAFVFNEEDTDDDGEINIEELGTLVSGTVYSKCRGTWFRDFVAQFPRHFPEHVLPSRDPNGIFILHAPNVAGSANSRDMVHAVVKFEKIGRKRPSPDVMLELFEKVKVGECRPRTLAVIILQNGHVCPTECNSCCKFRKPTAGAATTTWRRPVVHIIHWLLHMPQVDGDLEGEIRYREFVNMMLLDRGVISSPIHNLEIDVKPSRRSTAFFGGRRIIGKVRSAIISSADLLVFRHHYFA